MKLESLHPLVQTAERLGAAILATEPDRIKRAMARELVRLAHEVRDQASDEVTEVIPITAGAQGLNDRLRCRACLELRRPEFVKDGVCFECAPAYAKGAK